MASTPTAAPAPAWRSRPDMRRIIETLEAWADLGPQTRLLEIGPFDKPLFERSRCQVAYLDYFDTATLRERAAANPNRDPAAVVELDYVLAGRRIGTVVDRRFDRVVASHVLEHLPNLFGWLREVASFLEPGGRLLAVLPDYRYTFDLQRPPTSLGELIENDLLGLERPAMRSVFDQRYYHRNVNAGKLWTDAAGHTAETPRTFTLKQSFALMKRGRQEYIDGHCNLFDPEGFVEALTAARELGLQPFAVQALRPTETRFLDFMVRLDLPAPGPTPDT